MSRLRPLAMWVWYRGESFRGFQRQVEGPTVQDALMAALERAGATGLAPAGRTDRGVHARMQVVSIRAPSDRSPESLQAELSAHLPGAVGLCAVRAPPKKFHAQWSAEGKEYRYRFTLDASVPSGWEQRAFAAPSHPRLEGRRIDLELFERALRSFEGSHDFIAFHEKSSPRKLRTLESARVSEREGGLFEVVLRGSGFARYQVRYLVGSALLCAGGGLAEEQLLSALERGTEIEGLRAPAEGLVLWEVKYPADRDPFPAELRAAAPGLPDAPPFR